MLLVRWICDVGAVHIVPPVAGSTERVEECSGHTEEAVVSVLVTIVPNLRKTKTPIVNYLPTQSHVYIE